MKTGCALLSLLCCLAIAKAGRADTRGGREPLVILTQQGSKDAEDTSFFSSVRALAAEIGIVVSTEEVADLQAVRGALLAEARAERKPFLVVWILRENRLRTIHLFDPQDNQLRTRSIEAGESATANAEALALILRAELVAYLHEPSTTPSPPPPSPPPSPTPPTLAQDAWALTASYSVGTFLRGQDLAQGARLGILHAWHHLVLGMTYGLFPAQEVAGLDASIAVGRHPVDLDLGYASEEHHRLRWAAEVVLCGDWVSRHTSAAESPLLSQPDAGHFVVSVGARGRQELRLSRYLALGLALGIDAPLNPVEFQTVRGAATQAVARLSPIRFAAELGIKISAF